uniref:Uncharacterized protein n=1 Tax=Phytophthora ramorum TaxID=164328 RepID=H3GM51_PHYRM
MKRECYAAVLYLLWLLFGRASDLTMLRKAHLSIGTGDIFVRFIRVKITEEQGFSLFPDDDFPTCPLLAIAFALVTQSSPTASLLSQLSESQTVSRATLTAATPLIDMVDHPEAVIPPHDTAKKSDEIKTADAAPKIHSYVNRVLDRVVKKAVDFRSWNVEHDGDKQGLRSKTQSVAAALFNASSVQEVPPYNVSTRVIDTLMAYLLWHYPSLKNLSTNGLAIQRITA